MTNQNISTRSKLAAFLLCFFLGYWGIHNFYLGYRNKAVVQLLLGTFGIALFLIGPIISGTWAFVELIIMAVNEQATDADGNLLLWSSNNSGNNNSQAAGHSGNKGDFESRLKRLKALLDDGTITKSEFEEKKKQILEDI